MEYVSLLVTYDLVFNRSYKVFGPELSSLYSVQWFDTLKSYLWLHYLLFLKNPIDYLPMSKSRC